jgi:ABC-2 type transport system permease protein
MRNVWTILRRDLSTYFTSPIGYIYIIVFLMISVGLYVTTFFTFPVADMRSFFSNLPIILCVFIPAVTMRVWAEERKENTWEMLLTFPMRAWELVAGKFLATLVFYAISLAATCTVPIMLARLGNPDGGVVFGGYLGALLLGAFFLAIGIFFSAFFKDQIVAFVVTLLLCFFLFLVGTHFIAGYINAVFPEGSILAGLGSMLAEVLGVLAHYDAFTRGVVEMADVLFFLVWTVLFLVLNVMYIEGRGRPAAKSIFAGAVGLCVVIGLMFNWLISDQSLGRFDLTENKIYTASPASVSILSRLEAPVQVKYYATPKPKMPAQLTQLGQDVSDKLRELSVASGGKIEFTVVPMEAANVMADPMAGPGDPANEDEVLERRMLEKGVQPYSVQAIGDDGVTSKFIYSSLGVGYKDKREEIIGPVMPETLQVLEYQLVNTIHKLTQEEPPVVALVAPKEALNIDPQMRQLLMQMGQPVPESEDPYELLQMVLEQEKYQVARVDLTPESPLPDQFDALVVINPRAFNERQLWEINRALHSGKSVVMAVQNYEWDYQMQGGRLTLNKRDENPQVNPLLETYGVGVDRDILMDANNEMLMIQTSSLASLLGGGHQIKLPMQIKISQETMNPDVSITANLGDIFYLWGTAVTLDENTLRAHGLEAQVLMETSKEAWTVPADVPLTADVFDVPGSGLAQYPVMAMIQGQFPDAYADQARPSWPQPQPRPGMPPPPPPDDPEAAPVSPNPGKLILLGCSETFRKNFLQRGNLDLFLNSVDAITLGEELVHVRGNKPVNRTIARLTPEQKRTWRFANYALVPMIIAGVGITLTVVRRKSRNAYTLAHEDL